MQLKKRGKKAEEKQNKKENILVIKDEQLTFD